MSVGLLLVTHGNIGQALYEEVCGIMGKVPQTPPAVLGVERGKYTRDTLWPVILEQCAELEQGHGVLILTDLVGATPSNGSEDACQHCAEYKQTANIPQSCGLRVVTGVNLPMLLSVICHLNYMPQASLEELQAKAVESGHRGVMHNMNCIEAAHVAEHAPADSTSTS